MKPPKLVKSLFGRTEYLLTTYFAEGFMSTIVVRLSSNLDNL